MNSDTLFILAAVLFFLTFLLLIAVILELIQLSIVRRQTDMLEKFLFPREKKVLPGVEPSAGKVPPQEVPSPVAAEKKAETFQKTAPIVPAGKTETKEPEGNGKGTLWDNFWQWFCMGSFRQEEVSKEYAVATTWLVRAGVLILLCGIGFFLKYSIEKNLVTPQVRIGGTFLTALCLFGAGLYGIDKRFHTLAVGILSAGTVIFYMGAFAGYRIYHILPVNVTFLLMLLAAASALLVAVRHALLPVALMGCAGGYLIPLLLYPSGGNVTLLVAYFAEFSFLTLLLVSRFHRWRSLEFTVFALSFLLAAIQILPYGKGSFLTLAFLFQLFLVFLLIPLVRKKEFPFGRLEWILPAGSTVCTLILGVAVIHHCAQNVYKDPLSGTFALLLSVCALSAGFLLRRVKEVGKSLFPAYLSSSVLALFLVPPLTLDDQGVWICAWSVLGAVLIFSYCKSREKTLLVLGSLVFGGALFCLLMEYETGFPKEHLTRFFQLGMFSFALLASGLFLLKSQEKAAKDMRGLYLYGGGIAFFLYSSLEVYSFLEESRLLREFRNGGLSVWWALFGILLLAGGIWKKIKPLRIASLLLFLLALIKVYIVDIASFNTLQKVIAFILLGVIFLGGAFAYIFMKKRFSPEEKGE